MSMLTTLLLLLALSWLGVMYFLIRAQKTISKLRGHNASMLNNLEHMQQVLDSTRQQLTEIEEKLSKQVALMPAKEREIQARETAWANQRVHASLAMMNRGPGPAVTGVHPRTAPVLDYSKDPKNPERLNARPLIESNHGGTLREWAREEHQDEVEKYQYGEEQKDKE